MPLEQYHYRPATPPSEPLALFNESAHSRNTSGSSLWSLDSSPDSVDTHVTTPSRSPARQHGPKLLPKLRMQDQSVEHTNKGIKLHRRALSSTCNPPGHALPTRPTPSRSTTSPPECISLLTPISATSMFSSRPSSTLNSPIAFNPSYSKKSTSHSRSISASDIDDATLRRFGYPTYRSLPAYITGAHYSASVIPGSSTFVPPPPQTRPQPQCYNLPEELQFPTEDAPSMTLNEYLTGPNPPVNLVGQDSGCIGRGIHPHSWWDIRNLRKWEDFTLETIHAIPGVPRFSNLLSIAVPAVALPIPNIPQSRLQPDSEAALQDVCRDFYAAKVNAALKMSQGHFNHITMRAERLRDGPNFVSNYQNDIEKTLAGNGRGRVVGIVKSFDGWNTSMRHESPGRKVLYLLGLSHLHRYMREHSCRYGFIITEIELVCVRAGTDDIPYFGFLELAPTIEMKTQEGLTACMALWYLHMLAKEEPLPGQCGWRLEVGAPVAMTRMHVMEEKDQWIPDPQISEKRVAKTVRGWVMPGDPWNKKKEGGKVWNK